MSQVISSNLNNAAIAATRNVVKENSGPWWRFPIVWMVVLLPLSVVVASFVSFYLATSTTDTIIDNQVVRVDTTTPDVKVKIDDPMLLPAVVGRNHAATEGQGAKPSFEQGVTIKKD